MKKTKITFFIILILAYIGTLFAEPLDKTYIYSKHIILFIIIGSISYLILNRITKSTIVRLNLEGAKETLALSLKVIAFAGTLVLTSFIQMDYIGYSETLLERNCRYYDDYNNLIFSSPYYSKCPELEIIENTDNTLSFVARNLLEGTLDDYRFDENDQETTTIDMRLSIISETTISYDSNNRISNVSINSSTISEIYGKADTKLFNHSYSVFVENTYDGGFRQLNKSATYSEEIYTVPSEQSYHVFSEEDYETITYYSGELSEDSEFVLYKEYMEDEILVTEIQTTISYLDLSNGVSYKVEDALDTLSESTYGEEVKLFDGSVEVLGKWAGIGATSIITQYMSRNGYENMKLTSDSNVNDPGDSWVSSRVYNYQVISGKEYVIKSSTVDGYPKTYNPENTIYELEKYDYGFVVKQLYYPNDSYLKHLLQPNTSILLPWLSQSVNADTTSIFDVGYAFDFNILDEIIYSKPAYMYLD
jgi:hypothetical protein